MSNLTLFSRERRQYRAKFYKTKRWRHIRAVQLRKHGLCELCLKNHKLIPATICDHINNWQTAKEFFAGPYMSICHSCHNIKTKQVDLPILVKREKTKVRGVNVL